MLECATGSYCCDTNRPELSGGINCCEAQSSRFSLTSNIQVSTASDPPSSLTETPFSTESPMPSTTEDTGPEPSISTQTLTDPANPSLVCHSGLGEIECGWICCKSSQLCAHPGLCSDIGGASKSSTSLTAPEYTVPTTVESSQDNIRTTLIYTSTSPYSHQSSPPHPHQSSLSHSH